MNLKERFLLYWKDHKKELFGWILGLITFLFAGLAGGVALEETNPQTFTLRGARVTEVARVTPTPAQGRLTPSPTKPLPSVTPTVGKPSETPAPTGTHTPGATNTPLPFPTVTPTSIVVGHDVTMWHAPGVAGHHHGANWTSAHPEIVKWLQEYKYGKLFTSIGNLWASSPIENLYPWPMGKHEGHINLIENNTNCDLGKMPPTPGQTCVKAYFFQPHVLGNAQEYRARIHSEKLVALVCDWETQTKCGVVATGGLVDYGQAHSLYKNFVCPLADNPPYPEKYSADLPPYRTVNGTSRQFMFWSSLTGPAIRQYFEVQPNNLLQVAWNNRPFSSPSLDDCTDPGSDITFTNPENRNNTFQVFFISLLIADLPRPFEGFTDLHGTVDKTCTAPSPVCVPLYIGAGVPPGNALLNRIVDMGDPEDAPILTFGDANTPLNPPGTISNP